MFCHLHVHSEYSILESSVKIKNLIDLARDYGMKSVALTDMASMHGVIEFYKEAIKNNIKPIIGSEIFVEKDKATCAVLLLAKNITGYENLCKIISNINLNNKNLIDFELLKELSNGIIVISEFSNNEFLPFLQRNNLKEPQLRLKEWVDVFNKDFYIEIQRLPKNNFTISHEYVAKSYFKEKILTEFACKNKIKIVAGNNVHYLLKQDYEIYKSLAKLKLMSSRKNLLFFNIIQNNENYFKSSNEMENLFFDLKQAIANTQEISDKCSLKLEFNLSKLPFFKTPNNESQESYLKKLCYQNINLRYNEKVNNEVYERLEYELSVIRKKGFCGYFLIVADIAKFAHENKIPICGKGSSAGSLVTYLLGISNVDPIKQNLCFERFLNYERKNLPDIDIDMSSKGRLKVLNYLYSKYGKYNILRAPIFTTFKTRASIREAGRIINLGKDEIDEIITMLPMPQSRNVQISNIISKQSNSYVNNNNNNNNCCYPEEKSNSLNQKIINNNDNNNLFNISEKLKGYIRHIAMHPCAFIILNKDMEQNIPIMKSETNEIMSQYGIEDVESMGFLKIDLINSLTLDHIDEVLKILRETRNTEIYLESTDYNDKEVYKILNEGKTIGTFQLESMGIRSLMKKLKPQKLEDIILLISLYRPGPQQSGMVDIFIERKAGRQKTDFLHEDLKEILEETYGVMLYQEQVMKVAVKIAGYTFGEADKLRKIAPSNTSEIIEAERDKFIKGAIKNGYEYNFAVKLFNLVSKFANYGFVKAHAAAYAELGYKTCFLKAYFPAELLSVILTKNSGYYSKSSYIEEARRLGIEIKSPDINFSDGTRFLTEDCGKSIRVSLMSVRDLGIEGSINIIKEREKNGLFKSFTDFYERVVKAGKITIKATENLIKVGAFDFTHLKRKYLLFLLQYFLQSKQNKSKTKIKKYDNNDDNDQKSILINLINKNFDYSDNVFPELLNSIKDYSFEEKLELENLILEFCVSANPLKYFENELINFNIIKSAQFEHFFNKKDACKQNSRITTAGIVLIKRIEKVNNNKEIIFLTLEDWDGMYEVVIFTKEIIKNPEKILPGSPILVKGILSFKNEAISIIAKEIINLTDIKKVKNIRKKEEIKSCILSKTTSIWT